MDDDIWCLSIHYPFSIVKVKGRIHFDANWIELLLVDRYPNCVSEFFSIGGTPEAQWDLSAISSDVALLCVCCGRHVHAFTHFGEHNEIFISMLIRCLCWFLDATVKRADTIIHNSGHEMRYGFMIILIDIFVGGGIQQNSQLYFIAPTVKLCIQCWSKM